MTDKIKHGGIAEQVLDAVDDEIQRRYFSEVRPLLFVRPSDGQTVLQHEAFDSYIMADVLVRRKLRKERLKLKNDEVQS
jgi:hypothetical protein